MRRRLLFAGGFIISGSALTLTYIKCKPAIIAYRFNQTNSPNEPTRGERNMSLAIENKDQKELERMVNHIKYYEMYSNYLPNWLKKRVDDPVYDLDKLLAKAITSNNLSAYVYLEQKFYWELLGLNNYKVYFRMKACEEVIASKDLSNTKLLEKALDTIGKCPGKKAKFDITHIGTSKAMILLDERKILQDMREENFQKLFCNIVFSDLDAETYYFFTTTLLLANRYQGKALMDTGSTKILQTLYDQQWRIRNAEHKQRIISMVDVLGTDEKKKNLVEEINLTQQQYPGYDHIDVEILEKMVKKGAKINQEDESGATLLFNLRTQQNIIKTDKCDTVIKIVEKLGGTCPEKNKNNQTPWDVAIEIKKDREETEKWIVEKCRDASYPCPPTF